jgi:hypothetical protein
VVLYPDVVPFADNRFDCCDLFQRSIIHHGTDKASGMSSWFSCQPTYFTSVSLCGSLPPLVVMSPGGSYEMIKKLPESGGEFEYQIKFERNAPARPARKRVASRIEASIAVRAYR